MRIGIDARWLSKPNPSGIGIYLKEILLRLNQKENENEYFLFSNKPFCTSAELEEWGAHVHAEVIPGSIGSLWLLRELSAKIPAYHLDAFWGPEHVLPRGLKGVRKVLTVHDIALIIHPSWGKWYNALIQNTLARVSIQRADVILADSRSTKRDLITRLGVSPDKIHGVYPGRNEPVSFSSTEAADVLLARGESFLKPYLLYVGTLEPRKNVMTIIRAFERLKREPEYVHYRLLLAGGLGWKYQRTLKAIEESPYKQDILLLGYVSEKEKSILLHYAKAFLFPSFYEGFGMPVVEAICAGIPVITARNSSLQEVAGPAESYVERADDVDLMVRQIHRVLGLTERERKERNAVSRKHVERFDWDRCADRIAGIFR